MAFDYAGARRTAARLIDNFGQTASLRKAVTSGPSYARRRSTTAYSIRVVDLSEKVRDTAGTLTGQVVRKLLVSTAGLESTEPSKGDEIVIGGDTQRITEVRPLNPGGIALLWECDIES